MRTWDEVKDKIECLITRHPIGTNTRTIGEPCICATCVCMRRIAELESENKRLEAEIKLLEILYETNNNQLMDSLAKVAEQRDRLRKMVTDQADAYRNELAEAVIRSERRIAELEAENAELRSHPITDETIKRDFQLLMEQRDRLADTLRYLKICRTFAVIHSVIDEALASLDKE